MPELDPVIQRFIADVQPYVVALAEATAAANAFADANDRAARSMRDMPGSEYAAKLGEAAGAADEAGKAASEQAVKTEAAARASRDAGRAAFDQAAFERVLASALRAEIAAAGVARGAQDTLKDALDATAAAEAFAAQEAERLAQALLDQATKDTLAAGMARNLAEADAVMAAAAAASADAQDAQARAAQHAAFAQQALAFATGQSAMATAIQRGTSVSAAAAMGTQAQAAFAAAAANQSVAKAGGQANKAWALQIGWLRLSATALHWIIAGSAELLAVLIPAAVAAGVGAFVLYQGLVENVGRHLQALYTTMEATGGAFGKTAGDVLGLGHAFQTAQDAANPAAYELLGAYLNIARTRMVAFANTGLQVAHMLDEFSARVTVEMAGTMGKQIQGFLAGMTTDLQKLGQVFGNLGHFLLNLGTEMPGLAQILLGVLADISKLLEFLTNPAWYNFNGHIVTIVMAFEEFYRWGGLVMNLLVRLTRQTALMNSMGATNWVTKAGAAFQTLLALGGQVLIWMGRTIGLFGGVSQAAANAGTALVKAGGEARLFALAMSPAKAAGLLGFIALVAGLAFAINRYKDSAQAAAAKTVAVVQAAQGLGVFSRAAQGMADLNTRMETATAAFQQASPAAQDFGAALAATPWNSITQGISGTLSMVGGFAPKLLGGLAGVSRATTDLEALSSAQRQVVNLASTASANLGFLASKFHVTAAGAAALAQAAGVNLTVPLTKSSEAAKIAVQQINNLKAGLGAMSAPAGVIGADMEALGIQSQLAGTKVQQLNQAWDAWMASVTGGVQAMSQVQVALGGISKGALSATASINGAIHSVKLGVDSSTYSLKGFGQVAMQSWQQFLGAIQPAQQAVDSLRTGMSEGAVTMQQFGSTVRGLVGEFIPFVRGNRDAVKILSEMAHQAGGPITGNIKKLADWAGVAGKTARDQFARGMEKATAAMGSMAKVAQNLSAIVGQQLDAAMASSIEKSSGLDAAIRQYSQDLSNSHTPASVLAGDIRRISDAEKLANQMTSQAAKGLDQASKAADRAGSSARRAANNVAQLARAIDALHSKTVNINVITQHQGIFVGGGGPRAIKGASGALAAKAGTYLVGENGPEIVQMAGSERIFPNPQTAAILGMAPRVDVNTAGGDGGQQMVELHSHLYLDGKEVFKNVQQHGYYYNTRNSGSRTGKYIPGP